MNIRLIHIGNLARTKEGQLYVLRNYAQFYNELSISASKISVFAGYIEQGETGFEFVRGQCLEAKIQFDLVKGNAPDTPLFQFLKNNFCLFSRSMRFCSQRGHYFVFLPSPTGVWSLIWINLFKRQGETLGIYIGGYFGREQRFEKRKGSVKKVLKSRLAGIIDRLVHYGIRRSDYVITSSYEYFQKFKGLYPIYLTPPLLNISEGDLLPFYPHKAERYITFCGELRHAKGVMDLMIAFSSLVQAGRMTKSKLKIIGSGQALPDLVQFAQIHKLEDRIKFCGQINDPAALKKELSESLMFVLPSYSEGFPRVAYECFTLSVPCILTPVGGIPFLVQDGKHCLFVAPGDLQHLSDAISRLDADVILQAHLAENARRLMTDLIFPRIKTEGSLAKMVFNKIRNRSGNDHPVSYH